MMSSNLELAIKLDTDHLPGTTERRLQQTGDNMANVQNCPEGLAASADTPTDPHNSFSLIEAIVESSTSGHGMPAAKHVADISDGTEDTGCRSQISSGIRLKVSSAIRSSDTNKCSGWFQCSNCGQKVRGKARLRSHRKLLHKGSTRTKTVIKRNTSRFKCRERVKGKKNPNQHGFFAHSGQTRIKNIGRTMKTCSSIPPRSEVFADSTSQCSSSVERSNPEMKHLRLGPWFTCQSCDHIFKGRSQLQEHVRLKHQGLNEAQEVQPGMPEITLSARSEQCQGSVDSKLSDDAVTKLAPESPVENIDVESVVSSKRIWHQCDLCGVKVRGRKKLQRHIGKCNGVNKTNAPTVMTLQKSLSACETSAVKNASGYKCKHCCRHLRGRKRFMQHVRLCVKDGAALWQRISHWKQCSWYRCSGCQHTFQGKKRIQLHAFKCHTEAQLSCPSVEKSFEKKSGHTCTLCHKHFQRRLFLDKHMKKCQGQQRKINLSDQCSINDLKSREDRLGQEQGESGEVVDDNIPKEQMVRENDEFRALSDHQPCSKTQMDGDGMSQLTLVFLQDGSWYKCEICGQNLRGREQIKKHSHYQNSKKTETEELKSLNTFCLESEFLKVGTWRRCKICGKNLRGKEQMKNHSHAHEIKKPEEEELHNATGLESNFLRLGTWHRCKVCGEKLRGKEQVKNHSHELKIANPDDEKTECPNPISPCLDFVQVGTWYSCTVCGQKLQGRKQMQAHSHSQPSDKKGQGNSLATDTHNGQRSVEDCFIQVGSWYTCKSCLVRFRGRHSAEVHHCFKCFQEDHEDLLLEHCSAPRQGQDGVLHHDVQPTGDDLQQDIYQPTGDDMQHEIHQLTSDDIHQTTSDDVQNDIHQPTSNGMAHDINQAMTDEVQHDMHQPKSDVQTHGENRQYGYVGQAVSSMVPANVTIRDYIMKTGKHWECLICSKMILSWIGAFKHVRSHFTGTSLDCSICNKSFSSSGNRRKHERMMHDTENGSSALKKCGLMKSPHSDPQQRKTMNPLDLTRMNRKQFSTPTTSAACSQRTYIQTPFNAVACEYEVQKELALGSCDLKPSSKVSSWTASACAPAGDVSVTNASVVGASMEGGDVDDVSNVYSVADTDIPSYGTSEDNRGKWLKNEAFIRSGRRDQSPTIGYVDNGSLYADDDSGTDVSLHQPHLSNDVRSSDNKEMTSELCDSSENERQSVEDVRHDDYVLFSEYEDERSRDKVCIAELYEEQQNQIMSDGAKAPTETEYKKFYQTFLNLSSKVNQGKQEQDNNQDNVENESMTIQDSNVTLSDTNCLSRPLPERSDTDSHEYEGLSESGYTKFAVVQDCSLDADLIMSDVRTHPDLVWSDDEFMPLTDIYNDISMDYDPHSRKKETLNISRRRITVDNDRMFRHDSDMVHERFDVMDSARAERKKLLNSKPRKNRKATSNKCSMKTVCKPKQSNDMFNFLLMPSGDSERWRKRKQSAANEFAGEVDDKEIYDDRRTHDHHRHKASLECSGTSSKQIPLYKTRKELYVPEEVRFERRQEEKRMFMDCLDDGDIMSKGGQGISMKASSSQSCARSAGRDEKSRQGRYVCSFCYKTFASETVAADHLKQHERHRKNRAWNSRKKTLINVGFKKHCRVCQREFNNQADLELHECRHTVEDTVGTSKCVMCEICGEKYSTEQLLDQHKVGHQVWLKCSHCNLYFAKVTELHQHCVVARHFVCECGDAFTSYAKLDMHRDDCTYSN